jgi:hypothetical protein
LGGSDRVEEIEREQRIRLPPGEQRRVESALPGARRFERAGDGL